MEFIYATFVGLGVAAIVRYLVPGRRSYGLLLLPALGAVSTAALWAAATWAGWKPGAPWIWLLSLGGTAIVAAIVAVALWRGRAAIDAARLHSLSGGHLR